MNMAQKGLRKHQKFISWTCKKTIIKVK